MDSEILEDKKPDKVDLTSAVGHAVKRQRQMADITLLKLGEMSGVSSAMISRIENGQVSPSLSTLESLANALSIPIITFFEETIQTADIYFVKAGEGLPSKRIAQNHSHDYRILGRHRKDLLAFEAVSVTLNKKSDFAQPRYFNQGYVFITITNGECIYTCGEHEFSMKTGDSISFDSQLCHGIKNVTSRSVSFISVSAKTL